MPYPLYLEKQKFSIHFSLSGYITDTAIIGIADHSDDKTSYYGGQIYVPAVL
jgi:hypothetical protein